MTTNPYSGRLGADRQGLYRLLRVCGCCLFFVAIVVLNYEPATRILGIFALAALFSTAAAYELNARGLDRKLTLLATCLIFAAAGALSFILHVYAPIRPEAQGALMAAVDPAPPARCGPSGPSDLVMIFGSDRVIGEGHGPFTPVRIGTCPALTITRKDGGLVVDAFGFDADDNVIWRIQKNAFSQVVRGFLTSHRPDASTLRVADNKGKETLFIRYLNKNTLLIRGAFGCGDTQPVVIGDGKVTIGGRLQTGNRCLATRSRAAPVITYSSPGL